MQKLACRHMALRLAIRVSRIHVSQAEWVHDDLPILKKRVMDILSAYLCAHLRLGPRRKL